MLNESTIVISIIAFLAVVGGIEGFYLLYRSMNVERTKAVSRRLRSLSASGMSNEEAMNLLRRRMFSEVPVINRLLSAFPRSHALDRMLIQSGVDLTVSRYILIQLALVVTFFILLWLVLGAIWFVSLPIALVAGFYLPYMYVQGKTRERSSAISAQLPDALDYLARALRAGNPFSAAMRQASLEMNDPIAIEFATTFDELNFGMDLEDALEHLSQRTRSEEMRYFITAVLIQKTTGGNLAEVMNRLSGVMRARARTMREIRVLAAEMKLSANVLIGLPFIVAGALVVMNPGYLNILVQSTMGFIVIGAQLALMLTGYVIIQRMVNFRV
ncbi:type II secretion system F family protein [Alcanivorax sediminis]|uniref:Pilus assembly protein TadB n=1 Tax=Alcanivorax sediminis TaxID=2663008 RepID=A0A6N7LUU7_9GAMM|nr:type II secretion system F family protein [Alcanivorax sediminis]MQX52984.1 pilus assembly protein TadB [Alcanivorax sediminis]